MRKTTPRATAIPWNHSGRWSASGDDASYYRRRALEEQVMAERATYDSARECHAELAAMYRLQGAVKPAHPRSCESPSQEEASTAA